VRCKQLDKDIQDLYMKIGEMKKVKTAFEEEVIELKSREEHYKAYHSEKEKVLAELSGRLEQH
jgi:cell division protein FtsL